MKKNKKKILFFAETVTLAHIARCIALADKLYETKKYSIALAADDRYDKIIGESIYQRFPLKSISSDFFLTKLSKGEPLYSVEVLTDYVNNDLQLIEQFQPDFIVGDFRLSLAISSRIKNIPYATITNAYWSPYLDMRYPIPELPLTKLFGVIVAEKLFNLVKPIVFFMHSLALNKTCKKFGLEPLAYDMRESYTYADYTLYADIESLFSMKAYPDNHYFIGPALWSAKVPLPDWWVSIEEDKPVILVTLGSSGDNHLLPLIIDALSSMEITIICITARTDLVLEGSYNNVYSSDFLPAEEAVKKADIVICNGGSPMVYQSLVYNKKVIGIPGNLDQYLMMAVLLKSGQGEMIRSGKLTVKALQEAVSRLLNIPSKPHKTIEFNSIDILEQLIERST